MSPTEICDHLLNVAKDKSRLMVAIAGPPGSGKSTLAEALYAELCERGESCAVAPMDGFHLDNAVLQERSLLSRKGAPQTFDAAGFVRMVERLKAGNEDVVVPVFDRIRDRVVAKGTTINQSTRFILVEGNYLLLQDPQWNALQPLWDTSVFLNPGLDVIEARLIQRWLDNGLMKDDAVTRARRNDIPNARTVIENSAQADLIIA